MVDTKVTKIFEFDSLDENNGKQSMDKEKIYDLMMILFYPKIGINNLEF
jgi:hypothetical protein